MGRRTLWDFRPPCQRGMNSVCAIGEERHPRPDCSLPCRNSYATSPPEAQRWTRRAFLGLGLLSGAARMLAQQVSQLTVIALPHHWLNYGQQIDSFKSSYALQVNELDPDAGSGDELEAITANQNNSRPQAPDVVDVDFAIGAQAKQDGLLQPYQVSVWDSIPDTLKDPDGYWYGDYYGVMSFEIDTAVVENPSHDWSDLLESDYNGQVAWPAIRARPARRSMPCTRWRSPAAASSRS